MAIRQAAMMGLALMVGMAAAAPGGATLLSYVFDPGANNAGAFTFRLDDGVLPMDVVSGTSFVAAITAGTGVFAKKPGVRFYNGNDSGGLDFALGPQLYTGTEAAPLFRTGTFQLANSLANGAAGTLTVAPLAAAVPEPTGWAAMLVGLGFIGTALRRRRARTA